MKNGIVAEGTAAEERNAYSVLYRDFFDYPREFCLSAEEVVRRFGGSSLMKFAHFSISRSCGGSRSVHVGDDGVHFNRQVRGATFSDIYDDATVEEALAFLEEESAPASPAFGE